MIYWNWIERKQNSEKSSKNRLSNLIALIIKRTFLLKPSNYLKDKLKNIGISVQQQLVIQKSFYNKTSIEIKFVVSLQSCILSSSIWAYLLSKTSIGCKMICLLIEKIIIALLWKWFPWEYTWSFPNYFKNKDVNVCKVSYVILIDFLTLTSPPPFPTQDI